MQKRFLKQIAPLLVSLALVGGMSLLLRQFAKQVPKPFNQLVVETLPEVPELDGWPEAFIERLDRAHKSLYDEETQLDALVELSRLYHANGFLAQAQSCYLGLEAFQPEEATWPYLLAVVREDYGQFEQQILYLERALSLDPKLAFAYLRLGEANLRAGRFEEAREALEKRLSENSGDVWALVGLARVSIATGDFSGAEKLLLAAIEADGAADAPYELLPDVYQELGDVEKAKRYRSLSDGRGGLLAPVDENLAFFDEYSYDPYKLQTRAWQLAKSGEVSRGREILMQALALDFGNADVLLALGELHFADEYQLRSESAAWGAEFPFASVSEALQESGQRELALKATQAWLESEPESAAAYIQLGALGEAAGQFSEAESAYRRALFYDPNQDEAMLRLGMLLLPGDSEEGPALVTRYLDTNPQALRPRVALGLHYLTMGDLAKALDELERAHRIDSTFPGLERELASVYTQEGARLAGSEHFREAKASLTKAVAFAPDSVAAHMNLGIVEGSLGNRSKALEHFQKSLNLSPDDAEICRKLGEILLARDQPDLARAVLELGRERASQDERKVFDDLLGGL